VKFCTKRFRGNVLDLEASAITIRADKGASQERGGKRRTAKNQQAPLRTVPVREIMSAVPRMEPGHVVEASLADLADGVLVSVPGLDDTEPVARVEAASLELLGAARTAELPARYRRDAR
jgi:hypothetical protein